MMEIFNTDAGKRAEWTIPYSGQALAEAARMKAEYHAGRLEWWRKRKDEAISAVKTDGVMVTESIVDDLAKQGYSNTRGAEGPVVQIDAGRQAQLREAAGKVKDHERAVSVYDGWRQMMSSPAAISRSFEVTQEDWMFFYGK